MIPLLTFVLLLNSSVQTFLTQKIANQLSQQTHTPISIKGVSFFPFRSLVLKGVYIEDNKKDTLMYVGALKASIDSINFKKKKLYINRLSLDRAIVRLYEDNERHLNLNAFIDSLSQGTSDTTAEKSWAFNVSEVDMTNSYFSYLTAKYKPKKFGMNYDDIGISNIDMQARNIVFKNDTLNFDLKKMSCRDKGGFILKDIKGHNQITNRQWAFSDVTIVSPHSKLFAQHLHFNYIPGKGSWSHFTKRMKLNFKVKSSKISFLDLAYFNEKLFGFKETASVTGYVYGTIYDLKGKNIDVVYGEDTHIKGQFYMNGLPYIRETYLEADFKELNTTISDMEKVYLPGTAKEHLSLPETLNNLGKIRYTGKFNGFINDFVFYGDFKTELGTLRTDILLKPSPKTNLLRFKGDLNTTKFNLGGLLKQDKVGLITMNVAVNGFSAGNNIQGKLLGTINHLDFYEYNYNNLALDGEFSNSKFDGTVSIKDPNIDFDFNGKIDFTHTIPSMKFVSHINTAKLYPLHLNTKDSLAQLSLALTANLSGSGLDNANGVIEISDTRYINHRGEFTLKNITLNSFTTPKSKKLSLYSDIANAKVQGNYEVSQLISSLKNMVYYYLPAYAPNKKYTKIDSTNNFSFDILLKETQSFTNIIYPSFKIAPKTFIKGNVNSLEHQLQTQVNCPLLTLEGKTLEELKLNLDTDNHKLVLKGRTNKLAFSEDFRIFNISHKLEAENNHINFDLLWNNWDASTYSGYISAKSVVSRKNMQTAPRTDINLEPSTIIMADSIWNIAPTHIQLDSSSIRIDKFKISNKEQSFALDGILSNTPSDSISLNLNNINLQNLNSILGGKDLSINGKVNGFIEVSDFYNDRISNSDLRVKDLTFNTDTVGNLYLRSNWNKIQQKLSVAAFTHHHGFRELDFSGTYQPSTDSLDLNMYINKLRLPLLRPYLASTISQIKGSASGKIHMKGTSQKPNLLGKIYLNEAQFKINELQTVYRCNDSITLTPESIKFEQMQLTDTRGNNATIYGFIGHDNFDNIKLDIALDALNFNILNTKASHNESFYGKVYITGITHLTGTPNNLDVEITAKTERDTKIFIPLNSNSDIQESHFITFVNTKQYNPIVTREKYKIDLSGIKMNCDLDITPDANIHIIFDSKIGNILRAKGNGNLKLEIDTKGDFKMFGGYTIENGSYLFTLQDVINKKFDLENGGTIKWDGNPYDASVNINAVYNVKTALYDLLLNTPNIDNTKKVPVQCKMNLSNRLENPNIRFAIGFPTLDQQTQSVMQGLFASEDEINKQILSLLVLNRFYTPEYMRSTDPDFENKNSSFGVGVTTSELLSNQLSHWLSQISNDFDIGISYRPGDQITSDEVELALSTQIFDDKVTINGNLGMGSNQRKDNDIVGDVDVNIKLDKKGKLQLKAFTRSNEKLIYENSRNTQGIGIFYKEDFDTLSQLLKKYLNFISRKQKK